MRAVRRKKVNPSNNRFLCSEQFKADCFYEVIGGKKLLKTDAIPTVFKFPAHLQSKVTAARTSKKKRACSPTEEPRVCHGSSKETSHIEISVCKALSNIVNKEISLKCLI